MLHDLKKTLFLLSVLSITLFSTHLRSWSESDSIHQAKTKTKTETESWHEKIETDWGGHLKLRGYVSRPDDDSIYQAVGTGTHEEGVAEGRLKSNFFFGKRAYFEAHYETIYAVGERRRKERLLADILPEPFKGFFLTGPLQDDTSFMDLTKTIHEDEDSIWYHRMDRLYFALLPDWGSLSFGRQALTWGNGYVFNPMDLVNPFPPTDIERDYKIGSDMVAAQVNVGLSKDLQLVYVPRRDPLTDDVSWDQSTLGGKLHFPFGTTEFDLMAVWDYGEPVLGVGSRGYLGSAAWRFDATWTFLEDNPTRDGFLSLVTNLDYSWVWWGRNFYGLLEFYYNGLGDDDYLEALADPALLLRLKRGEIYTLGRFYLSGYVSIELHPLFNVYFTVINNLQDPSGVIQPRAIWSVTQNLELTFGANIFYGGKGSEYGGILVPGIPYFFTPAKSAYLWLSYYF